MRSTRSCCGNFFILAVFCSLERGGRLSFSFLGILIKYYIPAYLVQSCTAFRGEKQNHDSFVGGPQSPSLYFPFSSIYFLSVFSSLFSRVDPRPFFFIFIIQILVFLPSSSPFSKGFHCSYTLYLAKLVRAPLEVYISCLRNLQSSEAYPTKPSSVILQRMRVIRMWLWKEVSRVLQQRSLQSGCLERVSSPLALFFSFIPQKPSIMLQERIQRSKIQGFCLKMSAYSRESGLAWLLKRDWKELGKIHWMKEWSRYSRSQSLCHVERIFQMNQPFGLEAALLRQKSTLMWVFYSGLDWRGGGGWFLVGIKGEWERAESEEERLSVREWLERDLFD